MTEALLQVTKVFLSDFTEENTDQDQLVVDVCQLALQLQTQSNSVTAPQAS